MGSKGLTAEAPLEPVLKLFKTIETGCRTFVPESDPRDWAFLKTLPVDEAQPARRDFSPIPPDEDHRYDYNRLPAWMIVAIDKGSYIYGYGWNRIAADEQEMETIHLEKGDLAGMNKIPRRQPGHCMGSKRLTVEAPLEPVQKLFKTIETGCRTFFPESDPRDWVFLKAFPGGEAQPARRIFSLIPPDEDLYDYNRLPAWMIVAIDEGSYIYGSSNMIPVVEHSHVKFGNAYQVIPCDDIVAITPEQSTGWSGPIATDRGI
eukprot:jgi/Phyca11/17202/fgenesh1_pg.PHYCAscaffold_26_\